MEIEHENLTKLLKRDTVKRSTFEFWCPDISAQEHQMSKLLCIPPNIDQWHHALADQWPYLESKKTWMITRVNAMLSMNVISVKRFFVMMLFWKYMWKQYMRIQHCIATTQIMTIMECPFNNECIYFDEESERWKFDRKLDGNYLRYKTISG